MGVQLAFFGWIRWNRSGVFPEGEAQMTAPVAERLLTAEEYVELPDRGVPTELVRGRVVEMNVPAPRHGQICCKVARIVGNYADEHHLGHVVTNDSGVRTEQDPDTMRGADVAFNSYIRAAHRIGILLGANARVVSDDMTQMVFISVIADDASHLTAYLSVARCGHVHLDYPPTYKFGGHSAVGEFHILLRRQQTFGHGSCHLRLSFWENS